MVSTVAVTLLCKSGMLAGMLAQTLHPSCIPKGSSHKGLCWGTMQATDRKSSPHDHPIRSIYAEESPSTSDEILKKMRGSPILLSDEVLWFIFMQFREEPCL
jgi:hypothetical protein